MARGWLKLLLYLALFLSFPTHAHGQVNYVPDEVIVKLKNEKVGLVNKSRGEVFASKASARGMKVKRNYSAMGIVQMGVKAGQDVNQAISELSSDPEVEYVEPNFIFSKATVGSFTQTFSAQEIETMAGSSGYLATGAPIQVTDTWGIVNSNGVPVVAVIDTGVDTTHSVFTATGAIWQNSGEIAGNHIDDDHNGYVDDVNGYNFVSNSGTMLDDDGHGTHVAGIILGVSQNIYTPPYENSIIKIMPLKFLDGSGFGKTSDAIEAIYYAVANGATVMNNSWGGPSYSAALHEAVTYAYSHGVVFIAAAGNNGTNNDNVPMYPASYSVPNVVAVAATRDDDNIAYFSNYGHSSVDIGSPGVFIVSTIPGNIYGTSSGTSMAAPFVSGVAALMKAEKPNMMAYQIKDILMANNDVVSSLVNLVKSDARLNAFEAIQATKVAAVDSSQPEYEFTNADRDLASAIAGGGCGTVTKLYRERGSGGGGGTGLESWSVLIIIGLLTVPMIVYNALRRRDPKQRRKHERYKIDTEVRVTVGDRELIGSVSTISLGGVQINTGALLEDGGIVQMSIRSPDGKEQIQLEGRVVWSQARQAYGVQFAETAAAPARAQISNWTRSLNKA